MSDSFFAEYNPFLASALKGLSITEPTEIQRAAIPLMQAGSDLIACSETGSGKTLAYLLPIFNRVAQPEKRIEALILTPTHELAVQTHNQCRLINSALPEDKRSESALIIGGANIQRQVEAIKLKPRIIIGSAGRVLELCAIKKLSLHFVKTIVLDEGDRLLDPNNIDAVRALLKRCLRDTQLAVFSASMNNRLVETAAGIMKNPEIIDVRRLQMPETLTHGFIVSHLREKIILLRKILNANGVRKVLVFVNNPVSIKNVASKLAYNGISCAELHGGAGKDKRKQALADFREGRADVLIASDLAARGLDIPDVTHVINLDFPEALEDYVNRAGRVGRAGKKGEVISLVTEGQSARLMQYAKRAGVRAKKIRVANNEIRYIDIRQPLKTR